MTTLASSGYQLGAVAADGSSLLEFMENDWGLYRFDLLGQDATFGNPVPVTEVISSLMTDGGLTTIKSFGNRTAVFLLTITAPDTAALDDGEAAVMSALDSMSALAWHQPFGAASYFDVVASWSEQVFDDLEEVLRCRRTFRLTFECLPFARSKLSTTINWAGPAVELSPLSSLTGWTTVSGAAPTIISNPDGTGSAFFFSGGAAVMQFTPPAPLDEYLWIKSGTTANPFDGTGRYLQVGGVEVDWDLCRVTTVGSRTFLIVPTSEWRGQTPVIEMSVLINSRINEFYATSYPSLVAANDLAPRGVGAVDVGGTARTQCVISFTAPAGGAFVITGPDPNVLLRDRGAGESVFAHFTVTAPTETSIGGRLIRHEVGTHSRGIGYTDAQPVVLNPDGIWPQVATGPLTGTGISAGAVQYAYPNDPYGRTSVTFFATSGDKTLISPGVDLPTGYTGETAHHEHHALYPGRSLFAVLDTNGYPIPATVTYFKRWKHNAAEEE